MIVNKLALIVNDFINDLYSINIPFYKIILGLLVFNILVFIIRYMIINTNNTI